MSDSVFESGGLATADAPASAGRPAAAQNAWPRWWGRIICWAPKAPSAAWWRTAGRPFHHPVGAARHRQDHHRAAALHRLQAAFRAIVGGVLRRRRPEEDLRGGARTPQDGAGHAALHRRDPPLQPQPAGFVPAGDGGRHRGAGRRHHGESLLRTERRAAVARPGAGAAAAGRCGAGNAAAARRGAITAKS